MLKKQSWAEVNAVNRPAMIELVLIATSIEPEASPITTIGASNDRLTREINRGSYISAMCIFEFIKSVRENRY